MREFHGKADCTSNSRRIRRAYALSYAMSARPTPALATCYFDALRKMLDPGAPKSPATPTATPACEKREAMQ